MSNKQREHPVLLPGHREAVQWTLATLRRGTGARYVLLADQQGRVLSQAGTIDDLPLEEILSILMKEGTITTRLGHFLGDGVKASLHRYEGGRYQIYAAVAPEGPFLLLFLNQRPSVRRSGVVWLFLQRALQEVQELVGERVSSFEGDQGGGPLGNLNVTQARALGLLPEESEVEDS